MRNSSNSVNASADDATKESQKRRLQMEILILDSDAHKLSNEKKSLDAEIRKLKQDGERIRLNLESKIRRFDVVVREVSLKEEEAKQLKRRLNTL